MLIGTPMDLEVCIFNHPYEDGDWIILDCNKKGGFYVIQLEDTMQEALVYVPGNFLTYHIPLKDKRSNYSPKSFYGDCHIIKARAATKEEISSRRNMAFNPYDQHENNTFFPHSSANIETRGECAFASRNAIDGYFFNDSHGSFPYQSWGINKDPKAKFKIEFGRKVNIDEVVLTLRADFPHDAYWKEAILTFSDGSKEVIELIQTASRQSFKFKTKMVEWIELDNLIKAEGISEFPALTQFEAFGVELDEEIEKL